MYTIFMVIMIPVLALAWVAYYLWQQRLDQIEKSRPKQVSQHLQKTRGEVSDWAQKMATYKPPKRPSDQTGEDGTAS